MDKRSAQLEFVIRGGGGGASDIGEPQTRQVHRETGVFIE